MVQYGKIQSDFNLFISCNKHFCQADIRRLTINRKSSKHTWSILHHVDKTEPPYLIPPSKILNSFGNSFNANIMRSQGGKATSALHKHQRFVTSSKLYYHVPCFYKNDIEFSSSVNLFLLCWDWIKYFIKTDIILIWKTYIKFFTSGELPLFFWALSYQKHPIP